MLHPQYKTQYFVDQDWKEEWITTAKGLLRDEWNDHYKPDGDTVPARQPRADTSRGTKADDLFAQLDRRRKAPKVTEVEAYIRDEPIMSEFTDDPVKYWDPKCDDPFARMALDFVSAPGKVRFQCISCIADLLSLSSHIC